MLIKFVLIFTLIIKVSSQYCSHESAIASFKKPTYDFSINILFRVAEEKNYHFVFSPISTWLQLITLAVGAKGETEKEIQNAIKFNKNPCFRQQYFEQLYRLGRNLNVLSKRSSIIVLNKLMYIKNTYKTMINKNKICKVLSLNFGNPEKAAAIINRIIEKDTNGTITQGVYADDFNKTVLLLTDNGYFKSSWLFPFDPVYTSEESFYSEKNIKIGEVKMMNQVGYFKLTEVPKINAQVLELPFNTRRRISMLIVLPTNGTLGDLFYSFRDIRLRTIFNLNKHKKELVSVKLPRFKIETELDNIPELLYDMGIEKMFYPELSDFGRISDSKLYVSLMTQIANVEVTEEGARVGYAAEFLVNAKEKSDFKANRPFAYLIVDKTTEVILFAGMYSEPSIN